MENVAYGGYKDDTPTKEIETESVKKNMEKNVLCQPEPPCKKEPEELVPDLSTMPLDPRLIDSMDPDTMKKMLSKPSSRWDTPEESMNGEEDTDDPDDTS